MKYNTTFAISGWGRIKELAPNDKIMRGSNGIAWSEKTLTEVTDNVKISGPIENDALWLP